MFCECRGRIVVHRCDRLVLCNSFRMGVVWRSSKLAVLSASLDGLQEDRRPQCCMCCSNNPRGTYRQMCKRRGKSGFACDGDLELHECTMVCLDLLHDGRPCTFLDWCRDTNPRFNLLRRRGDYPPSDNTFRNWHIASCHRQGPSTSCKLLLQGTDTTNMFDSCFASGSSFFFSKELRSTSLVQHQLPALC